MSACKLDDLKMIYTKKYRVNKISNDKLVPIYGELIGEEYEETYCDNCDGYFEYTGQAIDHLVESDQDNDTNDAFELLEESRQAQGGYDV